MLPVSLFDPPSSEALAFLLKYSNPLGLAYPPLRRLLYAPLLDIDNFYHISPVYAARFQSKDETEEQYVERSWKEIGDKFQELGPDTVIGCESLCLSACMHRI